MPLSRLAASLAVLAIGACATGAPPTAAPSPTGETPTGSPAATASPAGTTLTVYSGRSEELVAPLLAQFTQATGIGVRVRYGDTAELAALLLEEGANSPADVYFAQDAGALGALAAAEMLTLLPEELLAKVDDGFHSPAGEWVGVSGRARVAVYDSRDLESDELPTSILAFTDPQWRGRLGWAPTNGSFQAFVTAFRVLRGDAAARAWLEGIVANEPRRFDGNAQIVQAVADEEIDVGFVNHYYLLRALDEQGPMFPVRNHFFAADDPGALINVAGVAILETSTRQAAATRLIEFLLGPEAQAYFATETFEYPLVEGVEQPAGAPRLSEIGGPPIDLSDLSDLQGTLRLLTETGVLP